MKIFGLWFNEKNKRKMLRTIKESISVEHQEAVMPVVRKALNDSAVLGLGGYPDTTSTVKQGNYEVIADVCGGGCAYVEIKQVKTILA